MEIRYANEGELQVLTNLACLLWPGHKPEELMEELGKIMGSADSAFFIAWEGETPCGFAQCQLRRDYVEGTETSPVGYLEGIYVEPAFRRRSIARHLLTACEIWAGNRGCREFASDCELTNKESYHFHRKMGFVEANRIICFTKRI